MKSRKIKMFATNNDTDFFVVVVDGYFQKFATREEALVAYRMICKEPDPSSFKTAYDVVKARENALTIAETPFGSCEFLTPHETVCQHCWNEDGTYAGTKGVSSNISDCQPIDIVGYINKRWQKWDDRNPSKYQRDPLETPVAERLKQNKTHKKMQETYSFLQGWKKQHCKRPLP